MSINERTNTSIFDWTYNTGTGNVTTGQRLDGSAPCAPIPELATIALLALVGYARIGRKK